MQAQEALDRAILVGVVGSQAYKINTASSDTDIRGVFIAPLDYYLGIKSVEQVEGGWESIGQPKDTYLYEVRKYVRLAADNNPNILEILWLDDYITKTKAGQLIIDNRDLFLSTKAKHTYSGYAHAQLRRIDTHRKGEPPIPIFKGINNEPLSKSEMGAFYAFLEATVMSHLQYLELGEEFMELVSRLDIKGILQQRGVPDAHFDIVRELTRSKRDFISDLQASQEYKRQVETYNAYLERKKNRNPERAALEAKCGYDGKHGAHCLRLLHMGIEILRDGDVIVNRERAGDAKLLMSIRHGDVPYERLIELVDESMSELDTAYKHSTLPKYPDKERINELCVELLLLRE